MCTLNITYGVWPFITCATLREVVNNRTGQYAGDSACVVYNYLHDQCLYRCTGGSGIFNITSLAPPARMGGGARLI